MKPPALCIMLSLLCLISLSCAGLPDEGTAAAAGDTQAGSEEAFDAHKQYVTLHFPDSEMDFAFQWVLGSISMGGCEIGEAFTTAGSITSGDAASWQTEWAAMTDKRIKAIAMNSAVIDDHAIFATMPVATATPDVVATWSSFKRGTVQSIAWRWGVAPDNIPGLVAAQAGYQFDPEQVTCPALALVGEGEYQNPEVRRQQELTMDTLPNPQKRLVITPAAEGASRHCIGENRSVMSQVVFDFFDEIFASAGGE